MFAALLQNADARDENRIGGLLDQPHQRQLQRAERIHREQSRAEMIRHEIVVQIGLHDHQKAGGAERNGVRQLIAQHLASRRRARIPRKRDSR